MASNGKVIFWKVARNWCKNVSKLSKNSRDLWMRRSRCGHFGVSVLAWGATRDRLFQKELVFKKMVVEKCQNIIKIELKWVPVAPFGLILSQNGSQCIQEAFGSPLGPWGGYFWSVLAKIGQKRIKKNPYIFRIFFRIFPRGELSIV